MQKSIRSERHGCHGALRGAETYTFRALILLLGIPKTLPGLDLLDRVSLTCSRPQIMEVRTCARGGGVLLDASLDSRVFSNVSTLKRKQLRSAVLYKENRVGELKTNATFVYL